MSARRHVQPGRFAAAAIAFSFAALSFACSRRESAREQNVVFSESAAADAGPIVDSALLASLSEARALHHEANVYEASNDPARATEALERLVHVQRPHPGTTVPEVEEVLADTYARLAELRLRAGNFDGAARDIQEGLDHAREPTYFRGHLFEVAGIIEEARAATLADAGQSADAHRAREQALSRLREAVDIQNKVISATPPSASQPPAAAPPR